jgi:foldase protein PrsA
MDPLSHMRASTSRRSDHHGRWSPCPAVWLLIVLALVMAAVTACGGEADDPVDAEDPIEATESPASEQPILAWVEGEPVTQADVDLVLAEARLAGEAEDEPAALEEAIGRVLLRREAERLRVRVGEDELEERIGAIRERVGGESELAARLLTAAMTREQLRLGAEYGLLRERLRDQKFADRVASDGAVRRFYDENRDTAFTTPAAVRLGSILFRGENAAKGVTAKLRRGKSFEDMARMYSRDPETARNGGMLGWVQASSLPDPLARAVEGLQRGELSGVVEGPGGWYVLKVFDRREAKTRTFAEVEGELRAEMDRRERLQALEGWLERERERVNIQRDAG